jgi:hypothetical protein
MVSAGKVSLGDKILVNKNHVQTYVIFDEARATAPTASNEDKVIAALKRDKAMTVQQIAIEVCHRALHTSVRGHMNGLDPHMPCLKQCLCSCGCTHPPLLVAPVLPCPH